MPPRGTVDRRCRWSPPSPGQPLTVDDVRAPLDLVLDATARRPVTVTTGRSLVR